jgi:hypothetical protein
MTIGDEGFVRSSFGERLAAESFAVQDLLLEKGY